MLVEQLVEKKVPKYLIKSLSETHGQIKFEGYLESEYMHQGERFPVYCHPVKDAERMEDVKLKTYSSKKRAENFVNGRSGGLLSYYWDYEVEEVLEDKTLESLGDFTGVYEPTTLEVIKCTYGDHSNAIRLFCWRKLIREGYLTEDVFNQHKAAILFFEDEYFDRVTLSYYLDNKYALAKDSECTFEMFKEYLEHLGNTDEEINVPKIWSKWHKLLDEYVMEELVIRTEYMFGGTGRYK